MTKINVIQPGTIEAPPGEITFLLLPERNAFQARATRLSALAEGHALADYLRFLAALARAQHEAMSVFREVPLPGPEEIERCREHGMPTLGAMGWKRDPAWRDPFRARVLAALRGDCFDSLRAEMMLSPACLVCGKGLTDPVSIARWIGPECAGTASLDIRMVRLREAAAGPAEQGTLPEMPTPTAS